MSTVRKIAVEFREEVSFDVPIRLTLQQRRIVQLMVEDRSDKEIAAALQISEHTVGFHMRSIFKSFKVHSRGALGYRYALHERAAS